MLRTSIITFLKQRPWSVTVLMLVIVVGIVLRLWQFGAMPQSLYWDEVAMLVDAKAVAATGADMHGRPWFQVLYPSYGDYKLPVYIWLASLSVKLFGAENWTLRLPSLLAGFGTILVAAGIAKELLSSFDFSKKHSQFWNQYLPWLAAAMVAISPWSIHFSRVGFEGHLGQLLLGLAVWCQLKARQRWPWLIPAVLLATTATYTYFSIRFVWPVVFVALQLLWMKIDWTQRLTSLFRTSAKLALPLLAFFVMLWPMTHSELYDISNQFRLSTSSVLNSFDYPVISNQHRAIGGNSLIDRVIYHRHILLLRQLASNYADHLSLNFIFITGDDNLRHGTTKFGLFMWPFLISLLVGLWTLARKSWRTLGLLGVWWIIALLPASVPETTPHALRSLNALLPLSLILAVGSTVLWHHIWHSTQRWAQALSWSWAGLVLIMLAAFSWHYFTVYPTVSEPNWQTGFRELAVSTWDDYQELEYVLVNLPEENFYLWLLAFGPFDGSEFATLPKENWKIKEIDTLWFNPEREEMLGHADRKMMIIMRANDVDKLFAEWQDNGITILDRQPIWLPVTTEQYEKIYIHT